ncbi:DUF305 domain-containing protein [Helicobacter jaachi]|uniref:DUF305 domain-containing protein n=1 Tax=Helicobacter jaachi TaxID=1677920 RepID=A0A4U8TC20_9HELI|nr:DUF305 domain-containing protein [Helicobacter jaachi]TLD97496.1 DUF305 domain-containing protein [Helicobacter jaachi]
MHIKLLLSALALSFAHLLAQNAPAHTMQHHQEMLDSKAPSLSTQILNAMHEPMMKAVFLEDDNLDLNFLTNMIPHHQGAIDSAKLLLEHSKNKKVRAIAQNIIKAQEAEIAEFEALLPPLKEQKKLYSPKEVTLFNNQAKADMEAMGKDMSSIKLTHKIDKDFLLGMIPHHQGAVNASKQILQYTQNEDIKAIALRIIKDQEQEIEQFQTLLKTMH